MAPMTSLSTHTRHQETSLTSPYPVSQPRTVREFVMSLTHIMVKFENTVKTTVFRKLKGDKNQFSEKQ